MQTAFAGPPHARHAPGYSVSVSDVLRLALPTGTVVLAGQQHLNSGIFWARLLGSRQPTLGMREDGEMVLLPPTLTQHRAFGRSLRDLTDAGVKAVVVAGDVSVEVVQIADELGIPMLRLPAGTTLVEAERAIVSLIVDREAQLRRRVDQIYERLLATLVDDAGIGALTAAVADVTQRPAVVLDEYFRVQVTAPEEVQAAAFGDMVGALLATHDPVQPGARPRPYFRLPLSPELSAAGSEWGDDAQAADGHPHAQRNTDAAGDAGASGGEPPMREEGGGTGVREALVAPLRLRGTPAGYLVLGGDAALTDLDRQVAERAARVLVIELAKQRAVTEAQLRLQGDFLDDLLAGAYPSDDAMLARARWMGHDLTRPHVLLAVHVAEPGDRAGGAPQRLRVTDLVSTEVLRLAPTALLREYQGTLVVAIPRASPPTTEESVEVADRLRERLTALLPGAPVTVGIGRYYPGVAGLAASFREASQALAIGCDLLGGDRSVHFEQLGVQRLLFQLRDNPELAAFYDDLLGKLQSHDERQNAELVNTLEAFFECHGNHVRTAQRLHLHRNTLLYRLERVRQVLGVELDDPETRLALQVALKIGRVIGRRPLDGTSIASP
ncbi:MAG: helix-turn-helix domain-containing protein [Chloroflexi bacterium]|nr:helix-turn-helix domain-containing protein [Chloroflexota bacterium]